MSKTINVLQEELVTLVSKDEERQYQTEELHENTKELQREAEKNDVKMQSIERDVEKKDQLLEEKSQSITELEKKLSYYKQDADGRSHLNNIRRNKIQTGNEQGKLCGLPSRKRAHN